MIDDDKTDDGQADDDTGDDQAEQAKSTLVKGW